MSLFPAYADSQSQPALEEATGSAEYKEVSVSTSAPWSPPPSPECERRLLRSPPSPSPAPAARAEPPPPADYYEDCRRDKGNLRVSTLYWPARPEYTAVKERHAISARGGRRRARYWRHKASATAAHRGQWTDDSELQARGLALRNALRDCPGEEELWIRYMDLQEFHHGGASPQALAAAESALAALPASLAALGRVLRATQLALPPAHCRHRLRLLLGAQGSGTHRQHVWCSVVGAAGRVGPRAALEAASAALADSALTDAAYPAILYVYGSVLVLGGLSESWCQLLELVAAMALPPACFPPPADPGRLEEERLLEYEDQVINSGLPLSEVWLRVERAREAVQWRAGAEAGAGAGAEADPQRRPAPSLHAGLLRPCGGHEPRFRLIVSLVRLCGAPLLPLSQRVWAAWGAGADVDCDVMAGVLYAARRLPPGGAGEGRELLAYTSPRCNWNGYESYVRSLWTAALYWAGGVGRDARDALLCWRMRALLARAVGGGGEGERGHRLRREAKEVLKLSSPAPPLAFALFARLEAEVTRGGGGGGGGGEGGGRAALSALRAALPDHTVPTTHVLHIARIVCELHGAHSATSRWAVVSAALRRPMPSAEQLGEWPSPALEDAALIECETRCSELEQRPQPPSPPSLIAAMLPGGSEWAAARVVLAPPARRAALLGALVAGGGPGPGAPHCSEAAAVALCVKDPALSLQLSPLFPHNMYMALLCGSTPLWRCGHMTRSARLAALMRPPSTRQALGRLLPALREAIRSEWSPAASDMLCRVWRRAEGARGEGAAGLAGGALGALAVRAAAGQARGQAALLAALHAALHAAPHCRHVYLHAAALVPEQATALADLLLERELRLRALPLELRPLDDPPPPPRSPPPPSLAPLTTTP